MSEAIENYAMISDCHSAALVGKNGSIDWLCFPCFDTAACFASIVGDKENGRWQICPKGEYRVSRKYFEGTMVLETIFTTETGSCKLIDCMMIKDTHPTLIRLVEGIEGEVELNLELIIRFDYGSIVPWVRRNIDQDGIHAVAGPEGVVVYSSVPLRGENLHTCGCFKIKSGEKRPFLLCWHLSHLPIPQKIPHPEEEVKKAIDWWKNWSSKNTYHGFDKEAVMRSLLTLKALTYEPTGAIVAAPTTSLPELIGGVRNWDYRYSWLRDSSFTLLSFLMAGYKEEAINWSEWLLRAVAGTPSQVNIMYGIRGERRLTEIELSWLDGYLDSKPVRIGNDAYKQLQLDVFGEVVATFHIGWRHGIAVNENAWRVIIKMIDYVEEHWREPDEGIWEVRGSKQQFTHSKLMAWVAVDHALKCLKELNLQGDEDKWTQLKDEIHDDICNNAFNSNLNSFMQFYGSKEVDASLLMIPLTGFLPITDARVIGTIKAIEKSLMQDDLLLRYKTESKIDGLPGNEGCFLACSFWLVRIYNLMGKKEEAKKLYTHLLSLRNDVGLLSEEYSLEQKCLVGNFPQALSHISHISAAMSFDQ